MNTVVYRKEKLKYKILVLLGHSNLEEVKLLKDFLDRGKGKLRKLYLLKELQKINYPNFTESTRLFLPHAPCSPTLNTFA